MKAIAFARRNRALTALVGAVVVLAVAMPVVAYVVVPALVKSTLYEAVPVPASAPASSAGAEAPVQTLRSGELVRISAADYGTGMVRIALVGDQRFVRFENVDIAGAPDMYVYLSDRVDGATGTFVDLGKLKATNGSFNYAVPSSVDLEVVRSVVVWCRQFSVTVTYAVMKGG